MAKAVREMYEQAKEAVEPVREGISAALPGLSWDKIKNDIGSELKHQVSAGAHELAAALFTGQGFVMYPRNVNAVDDPAHGLPNEAQKEVEHDRGGMSM